MSKTLRFHTTFLFLLLSLGISAQDTTVIEAKDTVAIEDSIYRSPKKAAILSAILPGAGQVYNHAGEKGKRSIWKVPIIYAGLGTAGYFLHDNIRNYKSFRTEYVTRLNDTTGQTFFNPDYANYSIDNLRTAIDQYKNWRDMSLVAIAGIYILQIVDASVDAHLFNHDISPDLSLTIMPQIGLGTARYKGVGLTLRRR